MLAKLKNNGIAKAKYFTLFLCLSGAFFLYIFTLKEPMNNRDSVKFRSPSILSIYRTINGKHNIVIPAVINVTSTNLSAVNYVNAKGNPLDLSLIHI